MLAHQPIDRVEAGLDDLEAGRIGLDAVEVCTKLAGQVAELHPRRDRALGQRVEGGIDASAASQGGFGLGEQAGRTPALLPAGDRQQGRPGAVAQRFGVAQAVALRLQRLLLVGLDRGLVDLAELEPQQVDVPLPRALASRELVTLTDQADHLDVRGPVGGAKLEVIRAGEAVEDLGLSCGQHQLAMLVLAVEGQQPGAERLQVRRRSRAPGDEGRRAARLRRDAPGEHDLLARRQAIGDLAQLGVVAKALGELERPLDPGLLGAGPDDAAARTAAHQQVQRVGEHGLARSRLAGDRVEARAESQLGPLDQQQILDSQLAEHPPVG